MAGVKFTKYCDCQEPEIIDAVSVLKYCDFHEPDILAGQSNLSLKGKKPTTNYLDNLPEKGIRDNVVDLTGTSSTNRTV